MTHQLDKPTPTLAPEHESGLQGPVLRLLVPGLNEQPYVERAVSVFAAVRDAYPLAHVYFVTAARERLPPGMLSTTQAIRHALSQTNSERMSVLCDPSDTGNKASQLNWALQTLERQGEGQPNACADRDWIGVFDFDSQPDPTTAVHVARAARHLQPDAVQVVPLGTKMLGGSPRSRFSKAVVLVEAWQHLARSLGVERWSLDAARTRRHPVQYLTGAGMFIRRDTLRQVGDFAFVDDIPLGYRLSTRGALIHTVPVFNYVDLPETLAGQMNSLRMISRGVFSWLPVITEPRTRQASTAMARVRLAAMGSSDSFELTLYPWVAAVLTPWLARRGWIGRLLAVAWWAFPVVQSVLMRQAYRRGSRCVSWPISSMALAVASMGRRFWRTAGAWWLIHDTLVAAIKGRTVIFSPTRRTSQAVAEPTQGHEPLSDLRLHLKDSQ